MVVCRGHVRTDAIEACKVSQTPMVDYLEGRKVDPKFDEACRIFEQIVELRIIENIRGQAVRGTPGHKRCISKWWDVRRSRPISPRGMCSRRLPRPPTPFPPKWPMR